ncbi:hypothetical protein J8J14_23625 [Roseomonas sp. SSH11]|uniref:Uncharacterized protein n=1 Tax=Pararoseomonas baculiformis TaxID=2820812 RepID=A0ABS4AND5_9PROT|nr:hypothetical protein [Pararoseomonas baculiformis]MBP0447744.1 hypothetical protein [Pararoseomonas baculiformis]
MLSIPAKCRSPARRAATSATGYSSASPMARGGLTVAGGTAFDDVLVVCHDEHGFFGAIHAARGGCGLRAPDG